MFESFNASIDPFFVFKMFFVSSEVAFFASFLIFLIWFVFMCFPPHSPGTRHREQDARLRGAIP